MDDGLTGYLAARDRERAEAVDRMLGALTPRELALVREAAVMGYVQGRRVPGGQKLGERSFPGDEEILRLCLDSAAAFGDLYPTLAALGVPGDD